MDFEENVNLSKILLVIKLIHSLNKEELKSIDKTINDIDEWVSQDEDEEEDDDN